MRSTFYSESEALRALEVAGFTVDQRKKLIPPEDEFDSRRKYDPSERSAAAIDYLVEQRGYRCDL